MTSFNLRRFALVAALAALALVSAAAAPQAPSSPSLSPREHLGKLLFFDRALSARGNQSCATCHAPEAGWVGGTERVNRTGGIYEGSIAGRFGNRKPPSAAYATFAPVFQALTMHHGDMHGMRGMEDMHGMPGTEAMRGMPGMGGMRGMHGGFVGGNFWDGRATGQKLGSPAADQAMGPFLNPLEQALPDARTLVDKVCGGSYGDLFREVWGEAACRDVEAGYGDIALAIAAYEASREVNQFSSKYDAYLAGRVELTAIESRGLQLFAGKGRCANCHPHRSSGATPPLFTDFTFDNLGIPANPANPFYANAAANPQGNSWRDPGLGGFLASRPEDADRSAGERGKHRVPTLRNVDRRPTPAFVKAYGHNGYFRSLEAIVHFYNTRDVLPACTVAGSQPGIDCWPQPEVEANVNRGQLGRLRLTADEEAAIVAFLRTLSDGYAPIAPTGE